MSGYKLRVPQAGDVLYGDGMAMVADTLEEARAAFEDWAGEPPPYLHSHIGRCRVVYARDIEAGDCHEDAERGDTTVDYCLDDGRELDRSRECRVWGVGPPPVTWGTAPLDPDPVDAEEIPVGQPVYHRRLGSGKTTAQAARRGGRAFIACEFRSGARVCSVTAISVLRSMSGWPPVRHRLTVDGEFVAEGYDRDALSVLARERVHLIDAEWKAAQDALLRETA